MMGGGGQGGIWSHGVPNQKSKSDQSVVLCTTLSPPPLYHLEPNPENDAT